MRFQRPEFLFSFLLLIPVIIVLILGYSRGRRDLSAISGKWRFSLFSNIYMVKYFFSGLFFVLALSCSFLVLCGLSWGLIPETDERTGIDLVFSVDVSRSMLAQDVFPSRLSRSQDIIRGVMNKYPESRQSLVFFKGEAEIGVPMTEDRVMIEDFLALLNPGLMTAPGTNIEKAIDASLNQVPSGSSRNTVILLFTDGDQLSGNAIYAARRAAEKRIPLLIVGCGSVEGVPIVLDGNEYVVDNQGNQVVTAMDQDILQQLAEISGGQFLDIEELQLITSIETFIDSNLEEETTSGIIFVTRDRYQFFLLMAVIFFFLYKAIKVIQWKKTY